MVIRFYKTMITIVVVAIIVSLAIPTLASANSKVFSDVKKGESHYNAIMKLMGAGIIKGYGNGTFGIGDELQRQHGAVLLYNALDLTTPAHVKGILDQYYNDINIDNIYANQIAATTPKIFKGSNKSFNPLDDMTREQMATAIVNAFELKDNGTNPGINLSNVGESHKANVKILAQHGITNQLDNFQPNKAITRGQFATFIYKTMLSQKQQSNGKVNQYDSTHYDISFSEMIDIQMTKSPQTDSTWKWYDANKELVEYYANPRNFNEDSTEYLQFLSLSESTGLSAAEINANILKGKGILEGTAAAFIEAGRKYDINEVYLIAHALLETGNGTSKLAIGYPVSKIGDKKVPKKNTYNMYGVHAYDSCPVQCGSEHAYQQGWFTKEAAIVGGAKFIADDYINDGQNTLYKMRWNPDSPGYPQYATDVEWAVKQTARINKIYDLLETYVMKFDFPTFNNQPGPTTRPAGEAEFAVNTKRSGMTGETTTNLNLRAAPSTEYSIVKTLAAGTKVEIIGENSGWYKVKADGKEGWVSGDFIKLDSNLLQVKNIGSSSLHVRSESNTDSTILGSLSSNDVVTGILDKDGNFIKDGEWYKIVFEDNSAWVNGDYIKVK